jgi:hypothetical protein
MKVSVQKIGYVFYWASIFVVSISMIVYGISKPIQFSNSGENVNASLSIGHRLMWSFYSYSLAYPIFIGAFEILGGIGLLLNRTRVFACILLTAILSNIIIQDYIYDVHALHTAIFYQVLIIVILIFDVDKVKKVASVLFRKSTTEKSIWLNIIGFCVAVLLKYVEAVFF